MGNQFASKNQYTDYFAKTCMIKADKQILDIIRAWTTLFCPIKGTGFVQDLSANVYVNATDSSGEFLGTLDCTIPSNDTRFYSYNIKRM